MNKLLVIFAISIIFASISLRAGAEDKIPLTDPGDSGHQNSLRFSLRVKPIRAHVNFSGSAQPVDTISGLAVDTRLSAGSLSGGITYLKGAALRDNAFSSWYDGAAQFDLGLKPVFILPNEYLDSFTSYQVSDGEQAEGIAVHGGYELSSNIMINGAFLVTKAESTSVVDILDGIASKKANWQLKLGGAYRFKDNLVYSVNFGYKDGGDIFSKGHTELSSDNAYVIKHQLNMSF